jgi:pyridoxine 4-dehydrogenase
VTAAQLDVALRQTEVVTVSNAYSVIDRRDEVVLQRCEKEGIAYLPWFPLGGGSLARGTAVRANDAVREVADRRRLAAASAACDGAFPGTSRASHLEEKVAAASVQLTLRSRIGSGN